MAGIDVVEKPLWALSWSNWGNPVSEPMLGDILTFKRTGGGHVGIYVGEDLTHYHVLGGNQGNSVSVSISCVTCMPTVIICMSLIFCSPLKDVGCVIKYSLFFYYTFALEQSQILFYHIKLM